MSSQRSPSGHATPPAASIPSCFQVGAHVVRVTKVMEGRWTVSVDDGPSANSYATQAEAWEAGVREADKLDRAVPPQA